MDTENTIIIRWHIDDVREIRPDLNDVQLRQVLCAIKQNHDATIGVNWDVVELWAHNLFPIEAKSLSDVKKGEVL